MKKKKLARETKAICWALLFDEFSFDDISYRNRNTAKEWIKPLLQHGFPELDVQSLIKLAPNIADGKVSIGGVFYNDIRCRNIQYLEQVWRRRTEEVPDEVEDLARARKFWNIALTLEGLKTF